MPRPCRDFVDPDGLGLTAILKDERVEKLKQLAELQTRVKEQRIKLQALADNDPEILAELGTGVLNEFG